MGPGSSSNSRWLSRRHGDQIGLNKNLAGSAAGTGQMEETLYTHLDNRDTPGPEEAAGLKASCKNRKISY